MKWISVKDRLPESCTYVLVFADNQGTNEPKPYSIAKWEYSQWEFVNEEMAWTYGAHQDMDYSMWGSDITHWMPLPPPPKPIEDYRDNMTEGL